MTDRYRVAAVGGRHWRRLAAAIGVDGEALVERIDRLAQRVPAAFAEVAQAPDVVELDSPLPARLAERITGAVADARRQLRS